MSKADKKQRHNAKREAKKREIRRQNSVSPIKRLADAPGDIECWTSGDFGQFKQIQIYAFKRAAGLSGIACFLVDQGVVGLKDAWVKMNVDRSMVQKMLDDGERRGISMVRNNIDHVRRVVAGGARWAHDNGMRLPKDWIKCASVLGGVGDWASADVSQFALEFAGHPEDLRQRLISEPFDSYIRRSDIRFIFSDAAPYMDQRTGDYVEADDEFDELDDEELDEMDGGLSDEEIQAFAAGVGASAAALTRSTEAWLRVRGETPSPALADAWRAMLTVAMVSKASLPKDSDAATFASQLLSKMIDNADASIRVELGNAMEQLLRHYATDNGMIEKAQADLARKAGDDSNSSVQPQLMAASPNEPAE